MRDYDDRFFTDYANGTPDVSRMADTGYVKEYYYRAFAQQIAGETEGLNNGFILKMDWPTSNSKIVPSFVGAYYLPAIYDKEEETRYGSLFLKPELTFKPRDAFSISLGANLMFAWHKLKGSDDIELDHTDKIGRMHDDSNIYFRVQYAWGHDLVR